MNPALSKILNDFKTKGFRIMNKKEGAVVNPAPSRKFNDYKTNGVSIINKEEGAG